MSSSTQPKGNPSIFIDDPEVQNIALDFPIYANTLTDVILHSTPKFTVGIFGDWGTGKTTLILNIKKNLENQCSCIMFNAWRFEREKTHATIPLMLTIIENLLEIKKVKESLKDESSSKVKKIISKAGRVLRGLSFYAKIGLPYAAEVGINYDASKVETDQQSDTEKTLYALNESKPLLQEGVELIEELVEIIPGPEINKDLRLVVFVDDLDRCTPEKAAEVFESIKVFFDMKGIVFVLGLSTKIVEAAIDFKYKEFSANTFTGKDYLKKIIQVPFSLPMWNHNDLSSYVDHLIENYADRNYKEFFSKNKILISHAVEPNPREVKRLLNNFILANQMLMDNSINSSELLCLQALLVRWKWFYDEIIHYPKKLEILKNAWYSKTGKLSRVVLSTTVGGTGATQRATADPFVLQVETDPILTRFLKSENAGKIIFDIRHENWPKYRRAVFSEPELLQKDSTIIELNNTKKLLENEISRFNEVINESMDRIELFKERMGQEKRDMPENEHRRLLDQLDNEENRLAESLDTLGDLKKQLRNLEQMETYRETVSREKKNKE